MYGTGTVCIACELSIDRSSRQRSNGSLLASLPRYKIVTLFSTREHTVDQRQRCDGRSYDGVTRGFQARHFLFLHSLSCMYGTHARYRYARTVDRNTVYRYVDRAETFYSLSLQRDYRYERLASELSKVSLQSQLEVSLLRVDLLQPELLLVTTATILSYSSIPRVDIFQSSLSLSQVRGSRRLSSHLARLA